MGSTDEFFRGFAWPVPLAFAGVLAACRFEQGDLLYDSPHGYDRWSDALKPSRYGIEVTAPARATRTNAKNKEGEFAKNWKTTVEFTLTNYKATPEVNQVVTS